MVPKDPLRNAVEDPPPNEMESESTRIIAPGGEFEVVFAASLQARENAAVEIMTTRRWLGWFMLILDGNFIGSFEDRAELRKVRAPTPSENPTKRRVDH